jgi:cyclin B
MRIKDCVVLCDHAYTEREMKEMEVSILTALDFKICRPTALNFLERYQCISPWSKLPSGISDVHRHLGIYTLELTLLDDTMSSCAPSLLAAAALLVSNLLVRQKPAWGPSHVEETKMTFQMLKGVAKHMIRLLERAEQSSFQAVHKKFSLKKHGSVAIRLKKRPLLPVETGRLPPVKKACARLGSPLGPAWALALRGGRIS